MDTCFVMQPFDNGKFDKRYKDIFALAIQKSKLVPYRVDQDSRVRVPIQDIERGIRESKLCFAEITLDNPNVWFELGYAFAIGKEVILVCADERTSKFPFDIQHRAIITYSTASSSDFDKLKENITNKINALLPLIPDPNMVENDFFHMESLNVIDEIRKEAKARSFISFKVTLFERHDNDLRMIKLGSPLAVVLQVAQATFFTYIIDKDDNLIGEIVNPFSGVKKNDFTAALISVLDAAVNLNGLSQLLNLRNPIVLKNAEVKYINNVLMELIIPATGDEFGWG